MHRSLVLLGLCGWSLGCGARPPAAQGMPADGAPGVRPGIDVLVTDSLVLVRGRRVGLLTNRAGVDGRGISDVERLRTAGVRLVALFSPEHGFRGTADPGAAVASSVDSATGLPIYSLYGGNSAPTDEMLQGLDVLLVDLQDAGARYFTYITTTIDVMQAAAPHGIPVIVLDRPDPIGGAVQGNVLDTAYTSSIGRLPVAMRHGMTLGELALMARKELGLPGTLVVVPASGWLRTMAFDATGLPFIPPSPNLPTLESLFHYPGLCLLEGTNVSVGRGSDAPFEQIGAPWLDTVAVLARLRSWAIPGVRFRGVIFTPRRPGDAKYPDTLLAGIRLEMTDRDRYDPTATAVHLLAALRAVHPDRFVVLSAQFDRLAGESVLRRALESGTSPDAIVTGWSAARAAFVARRRPFLLYPPSQLP